LTLVPQLVTRRLRRALKSQREARPGELAFLAVVGPHPKTEVFVVSASDASLRITSIAASTEAWNWGDLHEPTIVNAPNGSFLSIRGFVDSRVGRIYPLKDDGFQFRNPDELVALLVALNELASPGRSRAV
jgi:hypothetical protein